MAIQDSRTDAMIHEKTEKGRLPLSMPWNPSGGSRLFARHLGVSAGFNNWKSETPEASTPHSLWMKMSNRQSMLHRVSRSPPLSTSCDGGGRAERSMDSRGYEDRLWPNRFKFLFTRRIR